MKEQQLFYGSVLLTAQMATNAAHKMVRPIEQVIIQASQQQMPEEIQRRMIKYAIESEGYVTYETDAVNVFARTALTAAIGMSIN